VTHVEAEQVDMHRFHEDTKQDIDPVAVRQAKATTAAAACRRRNGGATKNTYYRLTCILQL